MFDFPRYFTATQVDDFHWWWVKWRGVIRAVGVALILAIMVGGMCLTWNLGYDRGYRAAVDEAATLCAPLLKLFNPGEPK